MRSGQTGTLAIQPCELSSLQACIATPHLRRALEAGCREVARGVGCGAKVHDPALRQQAQLRRGGGWAGLSKVCCRPGSCWLLPDAWGGAGCDHHRAAQRMQHNRGAPPTWSNIM